MSNTQILTIRKQISVKGGSVISQLIYTQNSKNNAPILFLHGGPGWASFQLKWIFTLLSTNFPLIFYDQIGGGLSKQTLIQKQEKKLEELWTIDNFVQEMITVVQAYNLKEFFVYGHSWGASLAIEYFFKSQEELKDQIPRPLGLILFGPLISTKMWLQDANYFKKELPQNVYKTLIKHEAEKTTDHSQYQKAMQIFNDKHILNAKHFTSPQQNVALSQSNKSFNEKAYLFMWGPSEFHSTGTLLNYDRYDKLKQINIPVLFARGEFDEVRQETLRKFYEQVQNGELKEIKDATHFCSLEKPEETREIILSFYNKTTNDLGQ